MLSNRGELTAQPYAPAVQDHGGLWSPSWPGDGPPWSLMPGREVQVWTTVADILQAAVHALP